MAHLHASLMWHGPGTWIVDIATIIFLIELISGIILWWPVKWNKRTRDASFKIKWQAKFKRVNYDLHNVLGFYPTVLALVLTITGLIIAFHPLAESTITLFGGDAHTAWQKKMPKNDGNRPVFEINAAIEQTFAKNPQQRMGQIWLYKLDSAGFYTVTTATNMGLKSAENAQMTFVDKYTGRDIQIPAKSLKGEYVDNMVWNLHMGTWMGQVGKLFTFLCGLICTSLPITGFLIWWLRGRKQKRVLETGFVLSVEGK